MVSNGFWKRQRTGFFDSLSIRSGKSVVRSISKLFRQTLDPMSPLSMGRATEEPVDPRNVEALVVQMGSLAEVMRVLGAVQRGSKLWIQDTGVGAAQAALGAAALLGVSVSDPPASRFGEPATNFPRLLKLLAQEDVEPLVREGVRFCQKLKACEFILAQWFGPNPQTNEMNELRHQIELVQKALEDAAEA